MTDRPRALHLVGDVSGCTVWRIWQPCAELQRQGYPAEWDYKDNPRLAEVVPAFDLLVLARLSWPRASADHQAKWFRAMRRAGLVTVYEADDDLFTEHYARHQMEARGMAPDEIAERVEMALSAMRMCDGVIVSTPRLATVVRQYVDLPVEVVPNAIDLRWWRAVQAHAKRLTPELTIGWAGGARCDGDLTAMAEAWGRVACRYPRVRFVCVGHQSRPILDAVPPDRLLSVAWMDPREYPLVYRSIDIGCAPLQDKPFNRCKTPIKTFEYAASGAAVVASPTVYGRVIEHEQDGYLAETAEEWEWALSRLVERRQRRRIMAERLERKIIKNHSLEGNAWRWPAAWTRIVEEAGRQSSRRLILAG